MRNKYYDPDPMNAPYIRCAECQGEVYEHGDMYEWVDRHYITLICGDCLMEHLRELSIDEAAELLGARKYTVGERS